MYIPYVKKSAVRQITRPLKKQNQIQYTVYVEN